MKIQVPNENSVEFRVGNKFTTYAIHPNEWGGVLIYRGGLETLPTSFGPIGTKNRENLMKIPNLCNLETLVLIMANSVFGY